MTSSPAVRIVLRQVDWGEQVITEPKTPADARTSPSEIEHPEQHRIERAVTTRLRERGCDVPPEAIRDEVYRALERFRDVRVRQFVSILATRDVCAALLAGLEDTDVNDATG